MTNEIEQARLAEEKNAAYLADEKNYALWFTPDAIREHFDDDPRVQLATDERLLRVGMDALSCDVIYEAFHEALKDALENEGIRA
jgi:hypothetical protein